MAEERIIVKISDEQLDEAVKKADDGLKGVETAQRKLVRLIPGMNEAYTLMMQIETFMKFVPEVSALLILALVIREAITYFERLKEEAKEYEELIRSYRRMSHEEYLLWEEQDRQNRETYHSQPPS